MPQALEIIRGCRGLDIVGCDLVEVAPIYDTAGQHRAHSRPTCCTRCCAFCPASNRGADEPGQPLRVVDVTDDPDRAAREPWPAAG